MPEQLVGKPDRSRRATASHSESPADRQPSAYSEPKSKPTSSLVVALNSRSTADGVKLEKLESDATKQDAGQRASAKPSAEIRKASYIQDEIDRLVPPSDSEFSSDQDLESPDKSLQNRDDADGIQAQENENTDQDGVVQAVPDQDSIGRAELRLEQVLQSVVDCYPLIEVAIGELETAEGKVIASYGEFDSVLAAHSISQPLGFYQTYRNGAGITRPLFGGGEVYGTYRMGDGNFEPWYGERETNEGGELKAGFSIPILKDRNIDLRRTELFSSQLQQQELESNVRARLLLFQRLATQAYWEWLASGLFVEAQERILKLAEDRVNAISREIEEGATPELVGINNDAFIAKRKNDVIKAQRKFEKSAIKLSLFYRDENCNPIVLVPESVLDLFPNSNPLSDTEIREGIEQALSVRPELAELDALRRRTCIELRYAENLTMPKLDVKGFAGQDLGGDTSSKGDKSALEMQVGVHAEVPLQRREGIGKIRAAQGKLNQIDGKRTFVINKITAEVQDAASAINAAHRRIEQSKLNLERTQQALRLGRIEFDNEAIDILDLNILENNLAQAQFDVIDAQLEYTFFLTVYQTAITGNAF